MESESASRKRPSADHFRSILNEDNKRIIALQELPVAHQVSCTHLLLETILTKLDKNQLLGCRCVKQAWNERVCKLLRKRKPQKIEMNFRECPQSEFQMQRTMKDAERKLELLTETMTRSAELESIFPFSHCHFITVQLQLRNPVTQDFFSKCGSFIQDFRAIFRYGLAIESSKFLDLFINLLFNQLPNLTRFRFHLEHTCFENKPRDYFERFFLESDSPELPRPRLLPKLKHLEFSCTSQCEITKGILKAAVNLEDIHMSVVEDNEVTTIIGALIAQGKTHLISNLRLVLHKDVLGPIETLCATHLRINTLIIRVEEEGMSPECKRRAGKIVTNLITSNAESLESLDMHPFLLYSPLPFPLMAKLHSLTLYVSGATCQPLYLTHFKMSLVFPLLKSFTTHIFACERMNEAMFKKSLFGASYSDQVSTLTSLYCRNEPGEMFTRSLPQLFANLVHVTMGALYNIPLALNSFWSLAHLRTLEFGINPGGRRDEGMKENVMRELETGFTGFSLETCRRLAFECATDTVHLPTLESQRVNPSMLDAKCLRELTIRVDDCCKNQKTNDRTAILSHITRHFAFRMCPKVQVYVPSIHGEVVKFFSLCSSCHL